MHDPVPRKYCGKPILLYSIYAPIILVRYNKTVM